MTLCGIEPRDMAHTQKLALGGNIHTVIADIVNPDHMRQVSTYIDHIIENVTGITAAVRTVPVVFYGANALEFTNREYDYLDRESGLKEFEIASWAVHDTFFGQHGMNPAAVIQVTYDGYFGDRLDVSTTTPMPGCRPQDAFFNPRLAFKAL